MQGFVKIVVCGAVNLFRYVKSLLRYAAMPVVMKLLPAANRHVPVCLLWKK
jgi:hypothetical protein